MLERNLIVSRKGATVGEFPLGPVTSIGRSPSCTVVLDHGSVSRLHALLAVRNSRSVLQDAGSKNGVYIGRKRVIQATLTSGDSFRIGEFRCQLRERGDAEAGALAAATATVTIESKPEADGLSSDILLGTSEPAEQLYRLVAKAAQTRLNVLITGESGSGKGVVARLIHAWSDRASGRLVTTNCAAIPEQLAESELFGHRKGAFTGAVSDRVGKFQAAAGGTLFLDEVGDMSLTTQAKILATLEDRQIEPVGSDRAIPVDVRVVAATHRDLDEAVERGEFREDLLYRLAAVRIRVPPLRERPDDVVLLANHFLCELVDEIPSAHGSSFRSDALEALTAYSWPGNVRELRHVVAQALMAKEQPEVTAADLNFGRRRQTAERTDPTAPLKEVERRHLLAALEHFRWNISHTATALGIQTKTLRRKLAAHGLERPVSAK